MEKTCGKLSVFPQIFLIFVEALCVAGVKVAAIFPHIALPIAPVSIPTHS
jgi:hypothetical protein